MHTSYYLKTTYGCDDLANKLTDRILLIYFVTLCYYYSVHTTDNSGDNGGFMKWVTLIVSVSTTVNLMSCPTCVGMPTQGQRPLFERIGIRYVQQQSAQKPVKPTNTESNPKSQSYNPRSNQQ
jgi:hypothetical protein